jgi:hypothetical protein
MIDTVVVALEIQKPHLSLAYLGRPLWRAPLWHAQLPYFCLHSGPASDSAWFLHADILDGDHGEYVHTSGLDADRFSPPRIWRSLRDLTVRHLAGVARTFGLKQAVNYSIKPWLRTRRQANAPTELHFTSCTPRLRTRETVVVYAGHEPDCPHSRLGAFLVQDSPNGLTFWTSAQRSGQERTQSR